MSPEHLEQVSDRLRDPASWFLLAEDNDAAVGMACAMPLRAEGGIGAVVPGGLFLGYVFIVPERWGQGIGGIVLDAVVAEAERQGYHRIELWTHEENNERAHRLYRSRGFSTTGLTMEGDLRAMMGQWARTTPRSGIHDTLPPMRPWFGLHLPSYTFPDSPPERIVDRVVEQAQAAEAAGFSLVTVMDHLQQIPGFGSVTDPMLDGWSTLATLARATTKVRLGTLVSGVTYRNPAQLAKLATTLDVISGGRAILGIGAAWNEEEHLGYGFDFPGVAERMDRLEEALTIIRAMFSEERATFEGRHYRIHEALNVPRPIQRGGPRILIGGGGEQRTLKIAARHADLTHWFPLGLEALRHKNQVLEGYCEAIGRDPSTIERTMATPVMVAGSDAEAREFVEHLTPERRATVAAGTPAQMAEALQPYLDAGFTGFTFYNSIYGTSEQIGRLGELLRLIVD